jgi:hypothetical protein
LFPSAYAGRAVLPRANHALGYPASAFCDFPAPTPISLRPCGFTASRFPSATLFRWKRRSAGTFVVCASFSHVPDPTLEPLSRPGGNFSFPRRSWDCLILRSFAPPDRSVRVFASWAHVLLCMSSAASFIVAGSNQSLIRTRTNAVASGFYPCQAAVPCDSPAPL